MTAAATAFDATDTADLVTQLEALSPGATDKFGFYVVGTKGVIFKVET